MMYIHAVDCDMGEDCTCGARIAVVVSTEHEPPLLLGTLIPAQPDDEDIVRYYDSGPDEEEHFAPADCVRVVRIEV